jgi:hypothetical protein
MRRPVGPLLVTMVLVACGDGGSDSAGDESSDGDGLVAACEYIVENQDGVDPTPEEVEEVKRLADDAAFERSYETLVQLQTETPEGPSLANLGAFAEQASKVRAACANAGVVIPSGEQQ